MSMSKNLMVFGLSMMMVCAYFAGAAEPNTAPAGPVLTAASGTPISYGAVNDANPRCGPNGCGHEQANPPAEISQEELASGTPISYGAMNHDNPRCGPNGCGHEQANPYHRSCEKENRCRNGPVPAGKID